MCRRVDIIKFVMIDISENQSYGDSKIWCIELNYVDYTGESGIACVWLIGPSEGGEFQLSESPLFNEKCTGLD